MIIRKDTTKARRAVKTTCRGAAPAPLACYRRDARTPVSQRREGNPKGVTECSCVPSVASQQSWSAVTPSGLDYILLFTGVLPLPMLFSGLRPLGWETAN